MSDSVVHLRRVLAGVSLIVAPLLNWAAALLNPIGAETAAAEVLAAVEAQIGRATASALLDLAGTVWFVPAVLGLLHLLSPRAWKIAHIGAALALTGLIGFAGMHTLSLVQVEMVRVETDREAMIALWTRIEESTVVLPIVAMFIFGQVGGFILLSIGLFLTSSVPRLLPGLIWLFLAWDVGLGIAGFDPQVLGVIDPHMAGFAGLAGIGFLILRQSDEAWRRGEPLGRREPLMQAAS